MLEPSVIHLAFEPMKNPIAQIRWELEMEERTLGQVNTGLVKIRKNPSYINGTPTMGWVILEVVFILNIAVQYKTKIPCTCTVLP